MSPLWGAPSPLSPVQQGYQGPVNYGMNYSGLNTDNQLFLAMAVTTSGLLTDIFCAIAGHGAVCNMYGCIWSNSGVLLAQSSLLSVPSGSGGPGGQPYQDFTGYNYSVLAGTTEYIGVEANPSTAREWSVANNTGDFKVATQTSFPANLGAVTDCASTSFECGDIGVAIRILPLSNSLAGQSRRFGKAFAP